MMSPLRPASQPVLTYMPRLALALALTRTAVGPAVPRDCLIEIEAVAYAP